MQREPAMLRPGARIDGFVIGELLHSGRLGTAWQVSAAAPGDGGSALVMKVPRTDPGSGGEGLLGFETEVSVLRELTGPHVPRFIAAGELAATPYVVTELIAGTRLDRALTDRRVAPEAAARHGAAIADALHSLHAQGAIHLDLKPDNVILRDSGEAVLIDFGMAHHARVPDLLAEEKRFAAGSAPYISPEQVVGIRNDPRSDLFALGVVLYEMASGELPFGSPGTLAGLRDRLWLDPSPLRARVPATPPWFQEIVLRCLEVAPERRYQSAAHVAFDLRHPEQVPLTARAQKTRRSGLLQQAWRWWHARPVRLAPRTAAAAASHAPVIMVAVDTMHPDDPRHDAIRRATARFMATSSDFRLVCVSVVHGEPIAAPAHQRGIHHEHLVRLQHWVHPLNVAAGRLSLHVIESLHASAALLDFARGNNIDLIVIGAPGPEEQPLAWWRSVASGVSANARCSVHVVRLPAAADAGKKTPGRSRAGR
jgi:nucleotide-binding universal stress UspA family protein